jgi:hypothetical protein
VPASILLSDPSGVNTLLANLYNKMPMEDFSYNPNQGFNYHGNAGNGFIEYGWSTSFFTDEAINSAGSGAGPINDNYWGYDAIRQVNQFIDAVATVDLSSDQRNQLTSEAHFIRAYIYFELAKRYGGLPLISRAQKIDDPNLEVPRSTEKETWDFVLSDCDSAIQYLPTSAPSGYGTYRATKWAAYALKSRAALFAASVAKYWNNAPLTGEAVDKKLVGGMTNADANAYYAQCISASKAIIDNSGKQLYKPSPSNWAEAAANYQHIFETPGDAEVSKEIIFSKAYIDGSQTRQQGHNIDIHFNPSQTNPGYSFYGRYSPTLDLVDLYEDYSDNGTGSSALLQTRTDGNEDYAVADPKQLDVNIPFKEYDNLTDIFANKDARLFASIIVPGAKWKGTTIIMQGGLITSGGSPVIYADNSAVGLDGNTYYTYGAANKSGYSGFKDIGATADATNFSATGFSLKKFLQEAKNVPGLLFSSTNSFIDMRLAEIYLNYAEATVESGQGDIGLAANYLNAIRHRAGHTDNIPATLENVLKERRVELAFEGQRYWDLIRRRTFSSLFNNARRLSLVPVADLRQNPVKYIFVRAYNFYDNKAGGVTFNTQWYYRPIPGISSNHLVQNPQY